MGLASADPVQSPTKVLNDIPQLGALQVEAKVVSDRDCHSGWAM